MRTGGRPKGIPKTGGRTAGTPNKATVQRQIMAERGIHAALNDGLMPMDVLLARIRNQPLPDGKFATADQFAAAVAAAPYLHPRLSMVASKDYSSTPTTLDEVDRLLEEKLARLSDGVTTIEG